MPATPLGPVPGLGYSHSANSREFRRLSESTSFVDRAPIAEEVPVAFVYNAEPFVVVMASPSDLDDLGVGFSVTEGIVDRAADVAVTEIVRHSRGIELQMTIPADAFSRLAARRRALNTRTGCGLCGIEAIDQVLKDPPTIDSRMALTYVALWRAAAELEAKQPVNNETHAVHAAAFADATGALLIAREDVGRHNALDKVIGAIARASLNAANGFLIVTSRASYELIQKAAVAGSPVLAAVSRPTGLAIQLADQAGITLVGLLRGRSANVYTHPERLSAD